MSDEDVEVQRLKSLVKDLELQNTALRSQKQQKKFSEAEGFNRSGGPRRSLSSDGEDDFLDLSSMEGLDDEPSWLYSSPTHTQTSLRGLKKTMTAVFESPEILPRRRALSHKLREIETGGSPSVHSLFPLRSGAGQQPPHADDCGPLSATTPSSHSSSLHGSFNSEQAAGTNSLNSSLDNQDFYTNGANGYHEATGEPSAIKPSLLSDILASSPTAGTNSLNLPYSSGTFTRPKKKSTFAPAHSAHNIDSKTSIGAQLPADSSTAELVSDHSDTSEPSSTSSESKVKSSRRSSRKLSDMAAGDSSTIVLRRNQTRTIESSAVLEAQRLLSDSSSSLDHSEHDSVGALPGGTFTRRTASNNHEDKSKRESLDIQTLARLQEQSLRDSLTAVRKAPNSSSAGSTGMPGLNFSDLDSSTGSLSSNNEEAFHQYAENKTLQGSGTFRIRKSPRVTSSPSPTLEHNGSTPIIHKSVVSSRNGSHTAGAGSGRHSPQIRSSLSPRTIQAPKVSRLRKPTSSLPGPAKSKSRSAGIPTPAPRTGLRLPTNTQYSNR